ncbi:MAG TPA: MBOAT family O-acyltransferase [Alphaproteobacteria bacterium]
MDAINFHLPHIEAWQAAAFIAAMVLLSAISINLRDTSHRILVLVLSVIFIAWLDALSGLYLLIYAHVAYALMIRKSDRPDLLRGIAWASVLGLLSLKAVQAYIGGAAGQHIAYLIGISYYTFRISSTLFDTAKMGKFEGGYLNYLTYCLFFPIFTGGPIERYQNFKRVNEYWMDSCRIGMTRVLWGIFKKIFIADVLLLSLTRWLLVVANVAQENMDSSITADRLGFVFAGNLPQELAIFLFGLTSILRAYIDLSAFTDLAVGGSRLLGYKVAENFNRPLLATDLIDFWRRWHMTIAGWARDYIFTPLLLSTRRIALAIFLTMLFMGMWHSPSLPWLLWGIGHGLGMVVCGWWQRTNLHAQIYAFKNPKFLSDWQNRIWQTKLPLPILPRTINIPLRYMRNVLITGLSVSTSFIAWTVLFGYMSVIFIFVSVSDMATAMKLITVLFLTE